LEPQTIVLYGVATDFCNRYAVEGLLRALPRVDLYLVSDAVRAIVPEEGERLIAGWRERGIRVVTTRQIVEEGVLDRHLPGRPVAPAR